MEKITVWGRRPTPNTFNMDLFMMNFEQTFIDTFERDLEVLDALDEYNNAIYDEMNRIMKCYSDKIVADIKSGNFSFLGLKGTGMVRTVSTRYGTKHYSGLDVLQIHFQSYSKKINGAAVAGEARAEQNSKKVYNKYKDHQCGG